MSRRLVLKDLLQERLKKTWFFKKRYRKEFLVVFCIHDSKIGLLEYFGSKSGETDIASHLPIRVVDLLEVKIVSLSTKNNSFIVMFEDHRRLPIEFRAAELSIAQKWVNELNIWLRAMGSIKESIIYEPPTSASSSSCHVYINKLYLIDSMPTTSASTPPLGNDDDHYDEIGSSHSDYEEIPVQISPQNQTATTSTPEDDYDENGYLLPIQKVHEKFNPDQELHTDNNSDYLIPRALDQDSKSDQYDEIL